MILPAPHLEVVPPLEIVPPVDRISYIRALAQINVNDERYKPGYGYTYCNRLVHDALVVLGMPLPRRSDGWPMLANEMVKWFDEHWLSTQDHVTVDLKVNLGRPTVFGLAAPGHGHVGMVLPSFGAIESVGELLTKQAGKECWENQQLRRAFHKHDLALVKFYSP